MNKKSETSVTSYPNSIDTRVALLEASISTINDTLCRIEKRFDNIDSQFHDVRGEFKEIRKEMKSDFRWILAALAGFGAIMAHGFHWF